MPDQHGYWVPDDGPLTVELAAAMMAIGSLALVTQERSQAIRFLLLEQSAQRAAFEAATGRLLEKLEGEFRSGFETACEEITLKLRTEVWELCLPPVDAPKAVPNG